MKRSIGLMMLLVLTLITPIKAGNADGDAKNILPYPIQQKKLPNGLNVVTVPYNSPGIVSFYIIMRVGSRDEIEAGKTGFAHFFEHMMFRGTEKYSKEKYSEALKAIGASANANTSLDRTVYHMTGNVNMIDRMMELEADRFMNLKYSVQDFKTEAGAVKGEYTKNSSNPLQQLDEKINDAAFTAHTYKHTTMGFFKDVVDMPNQYEYSLEFFKRFYRPEYATILVVGDITAEKVNALSEMYFGKWTPGNFKSTIPTEPVQTETRFVHIQNPGFPPQLNLAYKGPAYLDESIDAAAINVLMAVMFSEKSDLYNQLVVKEQKLRDISGDQFNTRDPYLVQISASFVNAADMNYVKATIDKEIEKMQTTPVDSKLLAETKSRIRYSFAMHIDNPSTIAEALSYMIWNTGDPESLNRMYANLDKVSAKDLLNVAKKYLVPGGLTIGTISPEKESTIK